MTGEERSAALGGNQPELKRTLGSFQVFAISFAFISVAVGIFGTTTRCCGQGGRSGFGRGVVVTVTGHGSVENLTSRGVSAGASNYFGAGGGLMLATIMGLATLVGFDAAANLAEEAKDPYRTVPRAIIGSVLAAGVLGMVFLIALTVGITDIKKISVSDSRRARSRSGAGSCRSQSSRWCG
jgi:amino acid transporter